MTATMPRRLPGFAFETRAPLSEDDLPRMDVAVFVGFATRGPVDVPVPVEDAAQFASVFGGDVPLAWDASRGAAVQGQLAPAVRMFFANGGRRCWIVRVAGDALTSELPVPGLVTAAPGEPVRQLTLRARSPGSWADGVSLGTSLESERFPLHAWRAEPLELLLTASHPAALRAGDLLRLTWRAAGLIAYAGVDAVDVQTTREPGGRRSRLRITSRSLRCYGTGWDRVERTGTATLADGSVAAHLRRASSPSGEPWEVALIADDEAAPAPGEIVPLRFGEEEMLLVVDSLDVGPAGASPTGEAVGVRGELFRARGCDDLPADEPAVERLSLTLWTRGGVEHEARITGLGMAAGHPRHVELLPDDRASYSGSDRTDVEAWRDAVAPRMPAAGSGTPRLCIPLGVRTLPGAFLPARLPEGSALERDGLERFDVSLFADADLVDSRSTTLLSDAEYLRFLAPRPRAELRGLHAALAIDEATLIAVPDASQPGWQRQEHAHPRDPSDASIQVETGCVVDDFLECGLVEAQPPVIQDPVLESDGAIRLSWSGSAPGPYVLEESRTHDWREPVVVDRGMARETVLRGRAPGDYYYRVRAAGEVPSDWAIAPPLRIAPGAGWRARGSDDYRDSTLVGIHRLLLRLCAARRDLMAVLSLPEHYRDDDAAQHVQLLGSTHAPAVPFGDERLIATLSSGESDALSFAALYYGWLYARGDRGEIRLVAPDGAASGAIARRSLERGAWIAPANEALAGVAGVSRDPSPERAQRLLQHQVNVVRQAPRGFVAQSADTLAGDPDLRPINVRRLLILLRRAAGRLGATYVFEPNDDSFRRMVQRGFESLLGTLFERGALAGTTPETAFQVVTGPTVNTSRSIDEGRFIAELRVAPSRPLEFLTIRLVQVGDRIAVRGA